jgi:hypothetical protein
MYWSQRLDGVAIVRRDDRQLSKGMGLETIDGTFARFAVQSPISDLIKPLTPLAVHVMEIKRVLMNALQRHVPQTRQHPRQIFANRHLQPSAGLDHRKHRGHLWPRLASCNPRVAEKPPLEDKRGRSSGYIGADRGAGSCSSLRLPSRFSSNQRDFWSTELRPSLLMRRDSAARTSSSALFILATM